MLKSVMNTETYTTMTKELEEARMKFAKLFTDDNERMGLYQDLQLNALEAMVITTDTDRAEYERLLTNQLNRHIEWRENRK